jgi:hypothetical protein
MTHLSKVKKNGKMLLSKTEKVEVKNRISCSWTFQAGILVICTLRSPTQQLSSTAS